jgi:hypothetical protein
MLHPSTSTAATLTAGAVSPDARVGAGRPDRAGPPVASPVVVYISDDPTADPEIPPAPPTVAVTTAPQPVPPRPAANTTPAPHPATVGTRTTPHSGSESRRG